MSEIRKIVFDCEKYKFSQLLEEYEYGMMLARDELISSVLSELEVYYMKTYNQIGSGINISLEKTDFKNILPGISAVTDHVSDSLFIENHNYMEFVPTDDYKLIRISSTIEEEKFVLYEILYNSLEETLIIQNEQSILIMDEGYIVDNSFLENEITAILYSLSYITNCFVENNNKGAKVIDLAEYKRKKFKKIKF